MTKKELMFVRINNQDEMERAIKKAEEQNFHRISATPITFEQAKQNYHGNSKLILHLFVNRILNRAEWQISTLSVEKTYLKGQAIKKMDVTELYLSN